MTESARARQMAKKSSTPKNLEAVFAPRANSEKAINRRKRLDIQPFFYALTACLPDMDAVLETINPYIDRDAYQARLGPIHAFETAIRDTGYTRAGCPLWVPEHVHPDDALMRVAETGRACLPVLQDRYKILVRTAPKSEQTQREFAAFIERYGRFNTACDGIADHIERRAHLFEVRERSLALPTCALA